MKTRLKLMEKLLTREDVPESLLWLKIPLICKEEIHLLSLEKDFCADENPPCCHLSNSTNKSKTIINK